MEKTTKCTTSNICHQCKGHFMNNDNKKRQEKVLERFGKIPSDCVSLEIGGFKCPYDPAQMSKNNTTQEISQNLANSQHNSAPLKQYA